MEVICKAIESVWSCAPGQSFVLVSPSVCLILKLADSLMQGAEKGDFYVFDFGKFVL